MNHTRARFAEEHRERIGRLWPVPRRAIHPTLAVVQDIVPEPIPRVDITLNAILSLRPITVSVSLADIMQAVCAVTRVGYNDFHSRRREQRLVKARWVYFHLARSLTKFSLDRVGHKCGMRDHSTVIHGLAKIDANFARYADTISAAKKLLGVE